jgi:hypothetical protein
MKESQLLGSLLPSLPDFTPILQAIREKYNLPEISPNGDPITEIYLGDEIIPFDVFRKDIESLVRKSLTFLPPDLPWDTPVVTTDVLIPSNHAAPLHVPNYFQE